MAVVADMDLHQQAAAVQLWGGAVLGLVGVCKAMCGMGIVCIVSKAEEIPHVQAWSRHCLHMCPRQLHVE